jgi:hypothetical protein
LAKKLETVVRWWFGGPNGYFNGPWYEFKIILTDKAKKAFKELLEWLMRPRFDGHNF